MKHAWFDKLVFPSLHAINPSSDLAPDSQIPHFSGISALPFDSNDKGDLSPNNDQPMASPVPSHHTTEDEDVDMDLSDDDEFPAPPSQEAQPSVPRCLILQLGPHPTQVSRSIDPSNILSCQTCLAVAFSALSLEPRNHSEAMACNDQQQWRAAELKELENMANHNFWDLIPRLASHYTIPLN